MTDTITLKALVRDKTGKEVLVDENFVVVLVRDRRYSHTGLDGPFYILASVFGSEDRNTADSLRCYHLEDSDWGRRTAPRVNRTRHFFSAKRSDLIPMKPSTTKADLDKACEIGEKDGSVESFDATINDLTVQINNLKNERASLARKREEAFHSKVLEQLGIDEQFHVAKSKAAG